MSRKRIILIGSLILLLAAIAVAAYMFLLQPKPALEQGYIPYPHDALALRDISYPEGLPQLNTGIFTVGLNPEMKVNADGECEVWFRNSEDNSCHLMFDIRLKDSNLLIYRTGLIDPGEGIEKITFVADALKAMAEGGQDVLLTIYTFKLGSYENLGDVSIGARLTYVPSK